MDSKTFHQFPQLPWEIRELIWKFAAGAEIVSIDPENDGLRLSGSTPSIALPAVNFYTRSLGRAMIPASLLNRAGRVHHLDLEVDTVKVGMTVPLMKRPVLRLSSYSNRTNRQEYLDPVSCESQSTANGQEDLDLTSPRPIITLPTQGYDNPIRKLLSISHSTSPPPLPPTDLVIFPILSNLRPHQSVTRPVDYWDEHSLTGQLHLRRLSLEKFPVLGEFTVACTRAHHAWYLETFNIQSADMNSVPHKGCEWHKSETNMFTAEGGALVYDKTHEGAHYYQSKGIKTDTGLRWLVDETQDPDGSLWSDRDEAMKWAKRFESPSALSALPSAWELRPKIGLTGYSHNATSVGGMWGGFRYYENDLSSLEFSPLPWDAVKDAAVACLDTEIVTGHLPEMIIKVFIIRGGDEPPTVSESSCWERVIHWYEDTMHPASQYLEPEKALDRKRIRAMWHVVTERFNHLRWDPVARITC